VTPVTVLAHVATLDGLWAHKVAAFADRREPRDLYRSAWLKLRTNSARWALPHHQAPRRPPRPRRGTRDLQEHGGTLTCRSQPRGGSFLLTLTAPDTSPPEGEA
jgi:hypothetical protein